MFPIWLTSVISHTICASLTTHELNFLIKSQWENSIHFTDQEKIKISPQFCKWFSTKRNNVRVTTVCQNLFSICYSDDGILKKTEWKSKVIQISMNLTSSIQKEPIHSIDKPIIYWLLSAHTDTDTHNSQFSCAFFLNASKLVAWFTNLFEVYPNQLNVWL